MSSSLFSSLAPFESDHPNNFTFDHMKRSLISSRRVQLIKKQTQPKLKVPFLPSILVFPSRIEMHHSQTRSVSIRHSNQLSIAYHTYIGIHIRLVTSLPFRDYNRSCFRLGGRESCGGVDNFRNWMRIREVEKGD